ncbi:unnamed protein product [Acanthosepion pharaonis]|uniref:Reverse transcriptase domain-containing protein n=1 Tax=Acanthosepion pharaonis TaxID=158019 RepID=A0A812DFV0_ACAPH|nr:unnamed protein product [Sepia pharaonis]
MPEGGKRHSQQRMKTASTVGIGNANRLFYLCVAVPADNPLQDILDQFPSLIHPFTYTETVKHHTVHKIHTSGAPVFSKPRRLAPDKYKLARAEFQHMLDLGIIRLSSSPFASPLHMVPQAQEGLGDPATLQFLYRSLDQIDLRKAFYQIPVAEEHIHKTAITTPFGLYEFLRMPSGLRNAAQSFQQLIDEALRSLPNSFAYIDDLLIAAPMDDHKRQVKQVFVGRKNKP